MARAAYCTGCGVTFPKMHLMINHRRSERCGGRFLPSDEREYIKMAKICGQIADTSDEESRIRHLREKQKEYIEKCIQLRELRRK